MITLEKWAVVYADPAAYMPPECSVKILQGRVFGDPRRKDGSRVHTSPVKNVKGRIVETLSGSFYKLGKIDPHYREWLKENFPQWNWRKPMTLGAYNKGQKNNEQTQVNHKCDGGRSERLSDVSRPF